MSLLGEHKKRLRDGDSYKLFPDRVKEELGDLLWYLSNVATKHGLTLEDVARYNLYKTQRRWQPVAAGADPQRLFDEGFPEAERAAPVDGRYDGGRFREACYNNRRHKIRESTRGQSLRG